MTEALNAIADVQDEVRRNGFAFRSRAAMGRVLDGTAMAQWDSFAASWDDLGQDTYMADGGRYRRRRFAAFGVSAGKVDRKPHQSHYQSRDYNPLNGGIARWFEPVTETIATHPVTIDLLKMCGGLFDSLTGEVADPLVWHVEMHQFRIEAATGELGRPTPEGPHRDGVDWVLVLLVNRHNVTSGTTEIYDRDHKPLGQFTLTDPTDAVFVDDSRIFHGVTPIHPTEPGEPAFRDVLVLTFRRE